MCDEITERETQRWLSEKRLGRREFGVLGVSAVGSTAIALVPGCDESSQPTSDGATQDAGRTPDAGKRANADAGKSSPDAGDGADLDAGDAVPTKSSMVTIETPDGSADAYFVHPATGSHPGILMWPDILGLRDAFKAMATQLAREGYAVLVVNQYYRTAKAPVLSSWEEWRSDAGQAALQPMLAAITPEGISSDSAAFVDWLDTQAAVNTEKRTGTCGYCMGGPFTFRTAAKRPERVGALASLHGAGLVTDAPESPHLLLPEIQASVLIAIAQNDDERQPEAKSVLREAADNAGLDAEIEVYPAQHGWCAIDSAAYDATQARKARERMLVLFGKAL